MTTMTLFQRLALACHRLERHFAGLHETAWRWRHRDREVVVRYSRLGEDDEWVAERICDPDKVSDEPPARENRVRMRLSEAVAETDAGMCGSCFYDRTVKPSPH